MYLAASVKDGIFIGICGALLKDTSDSKIWNLSEVEEHFGEAPLRHSLLPPRKTQVEGFKPQHQQSFSRRLYGSRAHAQNPSCA